MNTMPGKQRFRPIEVSRRVVLIAPLTLMLLAASTVALVSPEITQAIQYDRTAIFAGQLWRMVTGHLAHWNLEHWFWDAAMFGLLGAMCERRGRSRYAVCLLASAGLISLGVWHLSAEMATYRGLSGVDSALFGLLAAAMWREQRTAGQRRWAPVIVTLVLGFAAKIGYELISAQTVFVNAGAANFIPVPVAHIVGFAVGVVVGAVPDGIQQAARRLLTSWSCGARAGCSRRRVRS